MPPRTNSLQETVVANIPVILCWSILHIQDLVRLVIIMCAAARGQPYSQRGGWERIRAVEFVQLKAEVLLLFNTCFTF